MSDARAGEADRPEPDARSPGADGLGSAANPDERQPKPFRLVKLVAASAAMAFSTAIAGLLAVVAFGVVFGRAAGPGFEVRAWAATAIGQLLLGALTLWRAPKRFGPNWRAAIGLRAVAFDRALAGRIALALTVYWSWAVLVLILAGLFGGLRPPPGLVPHGAPAFAAFALTAVVFAPVCEETFFRGYVQARAQAFLPPAVSIVLPAVLFALAHFSGGFAQPAVVFGLGVLAGQLRRASGSLVPGMVLHAVSNGGLVLLLALAR